VDVEELVLARVPVSVILAEEEGRPEDLIVNPRDLDGGDQGPSISPIASSSLTVGIMVQGRSNWDISFALVKRG